MNRYEKEGEMGWSRGTALMESVMTAAIKAIPADDTRKEFYKRVIDAFEDADWDNQEECMGRDDAFDDAMKELHPE